MLAAASEQPLFTCGVKLRWRRETCGPEHRPCSILLRLPAERPASRKRRPDRGTLNRRMRYANIPFSMTRASSWFTACKNILRLESFRARSGVVQNVFRGDSRRLTEQDASPARPDMPGVGCSGSRIFCSPYPRGEPRRTSLTVSAARLRPYALNAQVP